MIKQAAIRDDVTGRIYTGERHDDIIKDMAAQKAKISAAANTQGFITDTGVFLNRSEAAKHALECGQIRKPVDFLKSYDLKQGEEDAK